MLSDYLQTVDWSRAQFAMTAIYHWLFVPLTLGLGFIIAIMETLCPFKAAIRFCKLPSGMFFPLPSLLRMANSKEVNS